LIGAYPRADELHQTELSLPISAGTTANDVLRVCQAISRFQ
jgi:dTDP-4-amino-4,6-dideoxygalactose transaminase